MSVQEAIILLKAMLGEVRTNAEEEESAICTQFNSIQVRKHARRGHTETTDQNNGQLCEHQR